MDRRGPDPIWPAGRRCTASDPSVRRTTGVKCHGLLEIGSAAARGSRRHWPDGRGRPAGLDFERGATVPRTPCGTVRGTGSRTGAASSEALEVTCQGDARHQCPAAPASRCPRLLCLASPVHHHTCDLFLVAFALLCLFVLPPS
jgi:hypothetical protein